MPPRKNARRREAAEAPQPAVETTAVRGFWSGNLSFGLVSIPVNLITAQRPNRVALRMLSPSGTPLRRRYFCPKEDVALETADIVRGYEVEKDLFVVITDDELKAIAPKLSQEIDLRRFVPLEAIDPMYFEHGYFLVPGKAAKAYRLLARIMEERNRAGIATFVMRGKQYLVAITARGGLLRAETLRFPDELRTTADVGLGKATVPGADTVNEFAQRIEALRADTLDANELEDQQTRKLLQLIEAKRRARKDVVAAPPAPEEEPEAAGAEIVDLMKYLKESITGKGASATSAKRKVPQAAKRKTSSRRNSKPRSSAATGRRTR